MLFPKIRFFPSAAMEWNSLDHHIRKVESLTIFKNNIVKLIKSTPTNVFNFENNRQIKLITRLRVDLSHLREQKFEHSFQDTLKPICSSDFDVESFSTVPCTLMKSIPF